MRPGARPLSALLSQVLVAFTLEFDNQFELRMNQAGHPGALLSLVVWSNLMRFLAAGDVSVRDLAVHALAPEKHMLGCLERWGFVVLRADPDKAEAIPVRPHRLTGRMLRGGWGSGRGIRAGWSVSLTQKGRDAAAIWPDLFAQTEQRWEARFGKDKIASLRQALEDVVVQFDLELPHGLPAAWEECSAYPARADRDASSLALPALLSQLLLAFAIEFDGESRAPLALCANTLRVLGEAPLPVGEIPRLTGCSPETSGIGWQMKPYLAVEPVGTRGKAARLTPRGLRAEQIYHELVRQIEDRWEAKFGTDQIRRVRECLTDLFVPRSGDRLLIAEGLVPAKGTFRAGEQRAALGRRDVGPAARQRMRDMVAQSELFLRDPVNALPHYPLWDMNRGFGP
jgi:hypothetical protein